MFDRLLSFEDIFAGFSADQGTSATGSNVDLGRGSQTKRPDAGLKSKEGSKTPADVKATAFLVPLPIQLEPLRLFTPMGGAAGRPDAALAYTNSGIDAQMPTLKESDDAQPSSPYLAFNVTLHSLETTTANKSLPVQQPMNTNAERASDAASTLPSLPVGNGFHGSSNKPAGNGNNQEAEDQELNPAMPVEVEAKGSNFDALSRNIVAVAQTAHTGGTQPSSAVPQVRESSSATLATAHTQKLETNSMSQTQPTREIALKISQTDMPNVDIKLVDRGGRIQVAVRSDNPALAQSLRSDLGELVARLERKGFTAETSLPELRQATSSAGTDSRNEGGKSFSDQNQQQENPQRRPRAPMEHLPNFALNDFGTEGETEL